MTSKKLNIKQDVVWFLRLRLFSKKISCCSIQI